MKSVSASQLIKEVTKLTIDVIYGEELLAQERITSSYVQRPGLALAGYFEHIRMGFVELFGATEINFLKTISNKEQTIVLDKLAQHNKCLFVVTKKQEIPPALIAAAKAHEIPLVRSAENTALTDAEISSYLDYALAPEMVIHGVCVEVYGLGIVITGKSGVGKSECALELVKRGHRLVADDIIFVKRRQHYLVGSSNDILRNHIELRGVGILDLSKMFGLTVIRPRKKIDLFIDFMEYSDWTTHETTDRLGSANARRELMGVSVAQAICPVSPGRNMAEIVELVAKNYILKLLGHDSTAVFTNTVSNIAKEKR